MVRSLESGILGGLWLMLLILLIYSWRVVETSSAKAVSSLGPAHAVQSTASRAFSELSRQKIITTTLASFKADPLRIAEHAENWLLRKSDDYVIQKIAFMARYQLAVLRGPDWTERSWERVEAHLKRVKELGERDELFVAEASFWVQALHGSDPMEMRALAKEIAIRYSVFGLGQYLIGCTELLGRDRVAALIAMKTAVEIEPEQLRYQKALKQVQSGRTDYTCEFPQNPREWLNLSD